MSDSELMAVHPCIRIICYLVGAVALAAGQFCTLLAVFTLLMLYALRGQHFAALAQTGKLLYRLRWLFLSLWVLYAGFTPGTALLPAWGEWSPTREGVLQGLLRTAVLVCLIIAVQLLLAGTPRPALMNAIAWLGRPLRYLGVHSERLALRMVLVMETVPAVQSLFATPVASASTSRLGMLSTRAAQLYANVLAQAEQAPLQSITLDEVTPPPYWQWSIPIALAFGFALVQQVCG